VVKAEGYASSVSKLELLRGGQTIPDQPVMVGHDPCAGF
jgi:hypothetical protein